MPAKLLQTKKFPGAYRMEDVYKRQGEEVPVPEGSSDSGKVNINTAGKEQLMQLTGIGETRAEAILSYREQQGPFRTVEDLMKVEMCIRDR